jgi:hypothetical protein
VGGAPFGEHLAMWKLFSAVWIGALGLCAACSTAADVAPSPPRGVAPTALAPAVGPSPSGAVASAAPTDVPASAPVPLGKCALRPACDAPLPAAPTRAFKHKRTSLVARGGGPRHRGRDLFTIVGAPQWVIGKFAYGAIDKDLSDEEIDVHLLRGCGPTWEKIGTFVTSDDKRAASLHAAADGVEDRGGRIFVDLAKSARPLEVGRHRIRMVVAGDGTGTDQIIEVLPSTAKIVVSDIDGTLTSSETAVWTDIADREPPTANPGAADVMKVMAGHGHYLFYLTARPDWLTEKTREWFALHGFPPGILHTTLLAQGAFGPTAAAFKAAELEDLRKATGIVPIFAFGNMPSDVDTYATAKISASSCYFFQLTGDLKGGVAHDAYTKLIPTFAALPDACP